MRLFHNWTSEDFTCTWDGIPFHFKAGEVYRDTIKNGNNDILVLEPGIVETFAVHLADREMLKRGMDARLGRRGIDVYEEFIKNAITLPSESVEEDAPVPAVEVSIEAVEKPVKKRGRPSRKVEETKTEDII